MPIFCKKLNTGSHSFRLKNGKRVSVVSGGYVEVESIEELGNQADNYVELKRDEATKYNSLSPLKRETTRQEGILRLDSQLLNKNWRPGYGVFISSLKDRDSLEQKLAELQEKDLEICKDNLSEAWGNWKHQCNIDLMQEKKITEPEQHFIPAIARAQAELNICKEEIKTVKSRLAALAEKTTENPKILAEFRRKNHLKGKRLNDKAGRLKSIDGWGIVADGKGIPQIPEKNCSLREYMDECLVHQRNRAKEKQRRRDAECAAAKMPKQSEARNAE